MNTKTFYTLLISGVSFFVGLSILLFNANIYFLAYASLVMSLVYALFIIQEWTGKKESEILDSMHNSSNETQNRLKEIWG